MQKTIGTRDQLVLRRLLKLHREAAGLTQRQLATKLNTDHRRVYDYESGDRRMDIAQLRQYTEALGVPLVAFVQLYVDALAEDASSGEATTH